MKKIALIIAAIFMAFSCKDPGNNPDKPTPDPVFEYAKGADISWVTEMEKAGKKFYNYQGEQRDCFTLMKELGMNSIRLRVWVDPTDKWCGKEDLIAKAKRANNLGLRLMVDFHYSDSWADPGKQNKPASWKALSFNELKAALSNHTKDILQALKDEGITPEWVQIGNETADGMLWEDGRASKNMAQYAQLTQAGYNAAKSIFPTIKVMIHIDNGYDPNRFNWLLQGLKENGCSWDVIGMSLYPHYAPAYKTGGAKAVVDQLISNANSLISAYGSEIMVCEVGMPWDSAEECKEFLTYILTKVKAIPNNKGLGVFYWEPECDAAWNQYTLGAFNGNGTPTVAMEAWSATY